MPPARQFRRQPDPARVGGHVLDAGGSRAAAWNRSPTISGESGTTRSAVAGLGAARRVRIARATPPFGAGQTRRPPPAGAGSVVNRCGGGWSAVADAPSAPGESLASVLATCHPPRRRTRDGGVMDSRAASSRDALQQVGGTSIELAAVAARQREERGPRTDQGRAPHPPGHGPRLALRYGRERHHLVIRTSLTSFVLLRRMVTRIPATSVSSCAAGAEHRPRHLDNLRSPGLLSTVEV